MLRHCSAPDAGVTKQGDFRVEYVGSFISNYPGIDSAIESWMSSNGVHSAQFAFRQNGTLMFSQAYTMGTSTPLVTTTKVFRLFKPLKLNNWSVSPTNEANANPNEVAPDYPYTGPSVFDITSKAPQKPFNYEGGDIIWELKDGPTDLVTNAESVSAWAESETSDVDFSVLFSGGACLGFDPKVINTIRNTLGGL